MTSHSKILFSTSPQEMPGIASRLVCICFSWRVRRRVAGVVIVAGRRELKMQAEWFDRRPRVKDSVSRWKPLSDCMILAKAEYNTDYKRNVPYHRGYYG